MIALVCITALGPVTFKCHSVNVLTSMAVLGGIPDQP